MTKTLLWIVGGVVVVGAVVAIVAVSARNHRAAVIAPNGQEVTDGTIAPDDGSVPQPGGKKMAFSQFIKQSGSYQCTVDQYLDNYNIKTTGTVYLDNGKLRGNFSTNYNGMKIDAMTIMRDGFAYSWTSMANVGYKTPVANTDAGVASNVTVSGNTYSFNTDQIGDYDCQPWKAEASVFVVPADIAFQQV